MLATLKKIALLAALLAGFLAGSQTAAAAPAGSIIETTGYTLYGQAYSDNAGYINFYCSGGSVAPAGATGTPTGGFGSPDWSCSAGANYSVIATKNYTLSTASQTVFDLLGSAYSRNFGYLSLSGTRLTVNVGTGAGLLTGDAGGSNWGATTFGQSGQIPGVNFAAGTTLNRFGGVAYSQQAGWISFGRAATAGPNYNVYDYGVFGNPITTTTAIAGCGDGIVQANLGEQCDGTVGCTASCTLAPVVAGACSAIPTNAAFCPYETVDLPASSTTSRIIGSCSAQNPVVKCEAACLPGWMPNAAGTGCEPTARALLTMTAPTNDFKFFPAMTATPRAMNFVPGTGYRIQPNAGQNITINAPKRFQHDLVSLTTRTLQQIQLGLQLTTSAAGVTWRESSLEWRFANNPETDTGAASDSPLQLSTSTFTASSPWNPLPDFLATLAGGDANYFRMRATPALASNVATAPSFSTEFRDLVSYQYTGTTKTVRHKSQQLAATSATELVPSISTTGGCGSNCPIVLTPFCTLNPTHASCTSDTDGDSIPDGSDPDIDNDGIGNAADPDPYNPGGNGTGIVYNTLFDVIGLVSASNETFINDDGAQTARDVGDTTTAEARNLVSRVIAETTGQITAGSCSSSANYFLDGAAVRLSSVNFSNGTESIFTRTSDPQLNGCRVLDDSVVIIDNRDVVLEDSSGTVTLPTGLKSILIRGGSLTIKSNLKLPAGAENNFGIVIMKNTAGQGGNAYLYPNVTNVELTLYADGSLISTNAAGQIQEYNGATCPLDGSAGFCDRTAELRNQLLWRGFIGSANSLGGSDKNPPACPTANASYCSGLSGVALERAARLFDLGYLRLYQPASGGIRAGFNADGSDNTNLANMPAGKENYAVVIQKNSSTINNPPPLFGITGAAESSSVSR